MDSTHTKDSIYIQPARSREDVEAITTMFKAYAEALGIDLTFQDFATEINNMPGKYAPPTGDLLLARDSSTGEVVGAVGLRPRELGVCEMKRLYVTPGGRGLGTGKALVDAVVQKARDLGYKEMRLDTLANMKAAQELYRRKGFVEMEKYYETPLKNTVFMSLDLRGDK